MSDYNPDVGSTCMYRRVGGVKWCMCKVIAKYGSLIWIHNFYTHSKPVLMACEVNFMPLTENDGD